MLVYDRVADLFAGAPTDDGPCVAQHPKMLRNEWLGHLMPVLGWFIVQGRVVQTAQLTGHRLTERKQDWSGQKSECVSFR
ncbi:MAG: hypothetical protein ACKO91_01615 [Acidimicrobiales bacterium]